MSFTLGTDSNYGVPISVEFTFNGTAVAWGGDNLYSMAPLSNRSESVDGSYEISDLDVQLIDTNGSIWGSLGNGTGAFYKPFSATVYVGGQLDWGSYGPSGGARVRKTSNVGAATYLIHSGQVVEVSKANRMVRLKSQNNLRALEDMEWRFPYKQTQIHPDAVYGTYWFFGSNLGSTFADSAFDWDEGRDHFNFYAAVGTVEYPSPSDMVAYSSIPNRGTLGRRAGYWFPGTQFYTDFSIVKLQGTFLGTYLGTLNTDEEARRYGYSNMAEAEAAKTGTRYILNKSRLNLKDGTNPAGSHLFLQQNLVLENTPALLFREIITGHCVSPYFGTSDIEQTTFGSSLSSTAFQTFFQQIDPKGGKIAPYLKDLVGATYGNLSVDVNNKFVYRAYGPRALTSVIGTLDNTTIVDSSFTNHKNDAKNRFVVRYGFSPESDFTKTVELKSANWSGTTDNPLEIQTKWMQNDNEAKVFAQRMLNRFSKTAPKIGLTVSMKHSGVDLGSLFNVVDVDSGISNKVVEIVSYRKDFMDSRHIEFDCIDGESVYSRKGFGQWMGGTTLPSGMVSGTSTFGWGTSGTQANINQTLYGSCWVWW